VKIDGLPTRITTVYATILNTIDQRTSRRRILGMLVPLQLILLAVTDTRKATEPMFVQVQVTHLAPREGSHVTDSTNPEACLLISLGALSSNNPTPLVARIAVRTPLSLSTSFEKIHPKTLAGVNRPVNHQIFQTVKVFR
jgi:hypothetical protein